ncbi:glycine oxidase ThiO [Paenibacillus sp. N1-5-1-14]|uniref:glycine oxidase ThiO n=1 Tax=Paenibacillus radicibacter TaxID=2972488 RepID=UPI002159B3CF|nr:glycine oxidase ThiO [Paenibacillus radicibacter]MCR8644978.1 glycine oxidase ThiO [Paenibacillus radicibacter]
MHRSVDVVIIGGGVIGCSIAYQLAKRGIQAIILEKDRIASGASSAAAGMLGAQSEQFQSPALFDLARQSRAMFPSLATELREASGIDIGFMQFGMLKVALSPNEAAELQLTTSKQLSVGEQAEWLDAYAARQLEPELSDHIIGAMHIPGDGHVVAPDLTQAFARSSIRHGVEIREFAEVLQLLHRDGQIEGVKTSKETLYCKQVIVATGAMTQPFFAKVGVHVPIYPVKGECFAVRMAKPLFQKTIYTESCYLVPKRSGEILIGATTTPNCWDTKVTLQGLVTLFERAQQLIPAIRHTEWSRTWAGLRPQTATGMPYMGEHPQLRGLFLAAGHYRNGILLSPITGHIMAELITGHTPIQDIRLFAVPESSTHTVEV